MPEGQIAPGGSGEARTRGEQISGHVSTPARVNAGIGAAWRVAEIAKNSGDGGARADRVESPSAAGRLREEESVRRVRREGYFVSPPLPFAKFNELLEIRSSKAAAESAVQQAALVA